MSRRMVVTTFVLAIWASAVHGQAVNDKAGSKKEPTRPTYRVRRATDFAVTGSGNSPAWQSAEWASLSRRPGGVHDYDARFKVLYSDRGLYILMDGSDRKLTAKFEKDFENLWTEDVYEFFVWTDERDTVYFEYEISPLGYELPILVPNFQGQFLGWLPWHYDGERRIAKATTVRGGDKKSGSEIAGWTAEFFIPHDLLRPLRNVPPKPGTTWRANFYRVDHDEGRNTGWDWSRVGSSFHEFTSFGTLVFE